MMTMKCSTTLVMASCLTFAPVTAQQPFEVGVDAAVDHTLHEFGDNATRVVIPVAAVRVAAGVSDRVSIEGRFGLQAATAGDSNSTSLFLAPAIVYHFRDHDVARARPYIAASGGLSYVDAGNEAFDAGDTQLGVGAHVGTKMPLGEVVFLRLEGGRDALA
jgi:hypothetical protein